MLKYGKGVVNPMLCPVWAVLNIYCQGCCLCLPDVHPVAVYQETSVQTKLIAKQDTNKFLSRVAIIIFQIPLGSVDLMKWSTHSLRVMAANLFHHAGFSHTYIKNRLSWKSDSFLMYLQNTFYTDKHAKALDLELYPPTGRDRHPPEPHKLIWVSK